MSINQRAVIDGAFSHSWQGGAEFRALAEAMPSLIFATDARGRVIYTNSAYSIFTGVSPDDLLGLGFLKTLHPDDQRRSIGVWNRMKTTREPFDVEYRLRRHDGSYRWHLARGAPILDDDGNVTRWIGSFTDIDSLKQALARAEDANSILAAIGRSSEAAIYAKSSDGKIIFANEATMQILGKDENRVIDTTLADHAPSSDIIADIAEHDSEVLTGDDVMTYKEHWCDERGIDQLYSSGKSRFRRPDGSYGIVGVSVNKSEEQRLLRQATMLRERLGLMLSEVPMLAWVTDSDGFFTACGNGVWQNGLLGGGVSNLFDMILPAERLGLRAYWNACVEDRASLDTEVRLWNEASGDYVGHRLMAVPVAGDTGGELQWAGCALPVPTMGRC